MYRKNTKHMQIPLTSHVDEMPENLKKRLETSWAGVFYLEFFCRLDESPFEVLYSDLPSRPNVPVNVLVGLEFLKAGNGWTDEEMYDMYCYDVQVRYALGMRQLGEGYFDLRTVYYFRERLSRYMQESGINLLEKAFEQVTDEQIKAYQLKTGKQRMDSTQVASNIRTVGRLQLLVEVMQRVYHMLSKEEQQHYAETFAPYIQGHAGQYVYHLKGEDSRTHIQKIGEVMQWMLEELRPQYAQQAVYQMFERVFGEHYQVEELGLRTKTGKELSADSLQSPDDWEATYREKANKHYKGYVANLTETCDPENELQLITKVQVAANNVDDAQLMQEAVPELKERTELETLYTDGGYGSPAADPTMLKAGVEQIQTAIRGRVPSSKKLNLSDFEIKQTEDGKPTQITCQQGQTVKVQSSSQKKSFVAHFAEDGCGACPFADICPARPGKRDERWHLRFTQSQCNSSQRRRHSKAHLQEGRNLRAAVEATVREVKHHFPASKLPVRGKFRMACMLVGAAMVSNVRRIQRCLVVRTKRQNEENKAQIEQKSAQEQPSVSFFSFSKSLCHLGEGTFSLNLR